jgi:hypothetical protein
MNQPILHDENLRYIFLSPRQQNVKSYQESSSGRPITLVGKNWQFGKRNMKPAVVLVTRKMERLKNESQKSFSHTLPSV